MISQKKSSLKTATAECQETAILISSNREQLQKTTTEQQQAINEQEKIQQYLTSNSQDNTLITQFTGIKEKINNLRIAADNIASTNARIEALKNQDSINSSQYTKQQQLTTNLKTNHNTAKNQVIEAEKQLNLLLDGKLLREYRAEHDGLMREMVYLRKISDLETDRTKLEDGKPCPLCGAENHPFAEGNIPETDKTEKKIASLSTLINQAEQLKNNSEELKNKETTTFTILSEANNKLLQTKHTKDESTSNLQHLENELNDTLKQFTELQKTTLLALQPFGVKISTGTDYESILSTLSNRLEIWQNYQDKKAGIEKENNRLESKINEFKGIIESHSKSLTGKQNTINTEKAGLDKLITKRKELYGLKNPDDEESRLESLATIAEASEKKAIEHNYQTKKQLSEINVHITSLQNSLAELTPQLKRLESSFTENRKKKGFEDEKEFISNTLPIDERNRLNLQAKELDTKQANILTRKKDRETRLNQEIEKNITEVSMEELKKEQTEIRGSLKPLGEQIGAIKQQLSDNKNAKTKHQKQLKLIEAQQKEAARWNKLHSLIGSADGKKYRNFAQGLTFELMVSHANNQLRKMTDRYLLTRDSDQPLELNVVDNYQAGEIRSTKNLSGGESFIVSLSLALGLSKMASRKVRVDSLFLDEGFGTLDEEALETALETLSALQQDGKLIGVISHVSALKERINTQINVKPTSAGKSVISGPGCVYVNTQQPIPADE